MNSKQIGDITELQCITYFYKLGFDISIPYGENSRYDFIIDNGYELFRIQCKTCNFKGDYIIIPCRSIRTNRKGNHVVRYSKNEIDYFATYFNDRCYLISVDEDINVKSLRIKPPKNNQKTKISYLQDYELENVLKDHMPF